MYNTPRGGTTKKGLEDLGSGFIIISKLCAGEIGVGVLLLDELLNVVTRNSKHHMVRLSIWHARMQDGN